LNGFENLITDLKDTKIYTDFIKIIQEYLQKLYEYFEIWKKLQGHSKSFADLENDRTSVYVTSSNVIVHTNDEDDELNKKILETQNNNQNNEKNAKRKSSTHITSEHSLSPKNEKEKHCRFYSPVIKSGKIEDALKKQNKNEKNENYEKNEKNEKNQKNEKKEDLQKDIKVLKSEISKLIWEEERRVILKENITFLKKILG